jgi:hypothetical protein
MMGDWHFYDSLGRLRSQFFCKTRFDFTPVLLINKNNDTLVKNGTVRVIKKEPDWQPAIQHSKRLYRQKQIIVFEVSRF